MIRCHLITKADGGLIIIRLEDDSPTYDKTLNKAMFEISRDGSDMETHYDPDIHTIAALAGGLIPRHNAISQRIIDPAILPVDKTGRDGWEEDINGEIIYSVSRAIKARN